MGNPARIDGQALRAFRHERGLTQDQLAQQSGISRFHLNNLERGHKQPSFSVAVTIARALDVPLERITEEAPATT